MSPSLTSVSFVLADDELFELIGRMQIGVRGQVDLKQRTLGAADRGEKIVFAKAHRARPTG